MLYRRVVEHVRAQNWTAVGIDFVIVVVGVFVGIQLGNWNEHRSEVSRASSYVERLADDMIRTRRNHETFLRFRGDVRAAGIEALTYVENGADDPWKVILAFFQASQAGSVAAIQTTFAEMTSTGEVRLLADDELRRRLSEFYRVEDLEVVLGELPRYREEVRGLIPVTVQDYIWESCYSADEVGQYVVECPPPDDTEKLAETAVVLLADQELHRDLRYWISTQKAGLDIVRNRLIEIDRLIAMLEAND